MDEFWKYIAINYLGIIGILVSGIGLFLAFLQIRKIAKNTATIDITYKKTIEDLENNETFTNISTVLQKIEIIKSKIQENKIDELIQDLSFVAKLLVTLQSSLSNKITDLDLNLQKKMCTDLELKIITGQNGLNKVMLKDEYIGFSDLELLLTKINGELKYKKK